MNITGKLFCEDASQEVIELDLKYFPQPWNQSQWVSLDNSLNKLFVWRDDEKLLGFALFGITPGDDVAHLFKILIDPAHRGGSVVKDFWSALLKELPLLGISRIYLEVESTNIRAIKFYEKCGFNTLRISKSFYSNGEDALIMILTL